jgi:pyrophosphate--fructose-6-phosphate 1-phosphotransferase
MDSISVLERLRLEYKPSSTAVLDGDAAQTQLVELEATTAQGDHAQIREAFPSLYGSPRVEFAVGQPQGESLSRALRVGVVLSGGQAPGGHNVIVGLYDALQQQHPGSELIGFLGGPKGILDSDHRLLSRERIDAHRNTGGFDLIGSGRDKIDSEADLARCRESCSRLGLDGLVIIGGDDSNTNAAQLAESFASHGSELVVVGVPKTIDGDLKGSGIEASFGFDTATKLYSELIGNIQRDARSAKKYWHFIKLMGRSASHVTLECALRARPNVALIGEEVRKRDWTLKDVTDHVAGIVRRRSEGGRNYGVCLVPEGLIEFIPEIGRLISALNSTIAADGELADAEFERQRALLAERLGEAEAATFVTLPESIQRQLLLDRDSHGNVQVSRIETESLLAQTVSEALNGEISFSTQQHFFGYEGRCAAPSNFDANYTFALGQVAARLIVHRRNGYLAAVGQLASPATEWVAGGIPLTSLMQIETRKGRPTPVIAKALVDLEGAPFSTFSSRRPDWIEEDAYRYPGPIQYFGPSELTDRPTHTLQLEAESR